MHEHVTNIIIFLKICYFIKDKADKGERREARKKVRTRRERRGRREREGIRGGGMGRRRDGKEEGKDEEGGGER